MIRGEIYHFELTAKILTKNKVMDRHIFVRTLAFIENGYILVRVEKLLISGFYDTKNNFNSKSLLLSESEIRLPNSDKRFFIVLFFCR